MKKARQYVDDIIDGSWMIIRGGVMLVFLGIRAIAGHGKTKSETGSGNKDDGEVIDVEYSEGDSNG